MTEFNRGYSPDISAELEFGGAKFELASLGPDAMRLKTLAHLPRGTGVVRMMIDGQLTVYHVELPDGIDSERQQQRYRVVEAGAPTLTLFPGRAREELHARPYKISRSS